MPDQDRAELVRQWASEIIGTSYVPLARPEVESLLDGYMRKLVGSLAADPFSTAPAHEVGNGLVMAHFTGMVALRRTLRLVQEDLPKLVDGSAATDRVIAMSSALAAGFGEGLRERTLGEQEIIKDAVLRARDAAEEALRESEARFRAVFTSSALGIAIVSLDGRIEDVNASMRRIFHRTREELIECTVYDLADEDWVAELRIAEADLLAGEREVAQVQTRHCTPEGEHIWTQLSASLVRDADGEPDYQVVLYEDITERHMLQEHLRRQAMQDPLTGLANRTLLRSRLEAALTPKHAGRRVGLCYFDLDGFKAINDSLGHPIGDDLLRVIAQRLKTVANAASALVARMGGDEFVVLVPDSPGTSAVLGLVEHLLAEITLPVRIGGHELNASASVGVVEREVDGFGADELLRDVDITLYRAKSEGKAQWVLFDSELNEAARVRFKLSATMPAALDEDQFFVEYRPVVLVGEGSLIGAEAEVRWDHPDLGELDTTTFLGLAQETGLIVRLGYWVLRRACEHGAHWLRQLGDRAPYIGISLSYRQFRDPELIAEVQRILRETGMAPDRVGFGVPESALFDEKGDPVDTAEILAEMGVRLVVEDFGSDYTRLHRLRELPVREVKITGRYLDSFAAPDGPDPLDRQVLSSLVEAAKLLDLVVVIDGVDREIQEQRLRELGVVAVQGSRGGQLASALEVEAMAGGGPAAGCAQNPDGRGR